MLHQEQMNQLAETILSIGKSFSYTSLVTYFSFGLNHLDSSCHTSTLSKRPSK